MQQLEQLQPHRLIEAGPEIQLSILRALAYSEVFDYPLTIDEIIHGMDIETDKAKVQVTLQDLISENVLFKWGNFYSISNKPENLKLRFERNNRATKYLKWAKRISTFIGMFPFVRGVFISGSLSKNSMDEDSDIDYFIITEGDHLWTCRTLLILFKKIFLFNSYKLFCLNYFLDLNNLTVTDENVYIAHEINSLIPTYGRTYCQDFTNSNTWVMNFLPNKEVVDATNCAEHRSRGVKWILEKLLNGEIGTLIEKKSMNLSRNYWNKKFSHLNKEDISEVSISRKDISSHHPNNFKNVVLSRRTTILNELERKFNLKF